MQSNQSSKPCRRHGVYFGATRLDASHRGKASAILLVLGWSKSLPVTIGRPHLRIVTHGIEAAVLLPLVLLFGARWDVTGAAVAVLLSTLVFAATWAVVLVRLRAELRTARPVGAPSTAGS